ncbi:MAG: hypothetical protein VW397_09075, partial [Candidatus Margulisiibacteriota bacterium]
MLSLNFYISLSFTKKKIVSTPRSSDPKDTGHFGDSVFLVQDQTNPSGSYTKDGDSFYDNTPTSSPPRSCKSEGQTDGSSPELFPNNYLSSTSPNIRNLKTPDRQYRRVVSFLIDDAADPISAVKDKINGHLKKIDTLFNEKLQ